MGAPYLKNGKAHTADWFSFVVSVLLSGLSVLLLLSAYTQGDASLRTVFMQMIAMILGMVGCVFLSRIDYHRVLRWCPLFAVLAVGLVLLLKVPGLAFMPEGSDDLAWIKVGAFSLQPSEILKLAFIYTFALHLSKVREHINELMTFLLLCLHGAVPTLLIMDTGDYGSALVFFFIFVVMMFAANLNRRFLLIGAAAVAVLIPIVFHLLPTYLQNRFRVAWHPELDANGMGYQQYQGRLALSSGGLTGKGLFASEMDMVYVPESNNDFIFSYLGQCFGFVGCIVVVSLLAFLFAKVLLTAGLAMDEAGAYISVGVFGMLLSQTIINIGMVLCVIPVVGLTLPFVSSGGTSMVICFAAVGMSMGVSRYENQKL